MNLEPFHLMGPEGPGENWQLFLGAADCAHCSEAFEQANRHSGGYGWEGVALFFLEEVLDEAVASRIDLNCESDTFVAYSADRDPLLALANLVLPLVDDLEALTAILETAPVDSWSEMFLR